MSTQAPHDAPLAATVRPMPRMYTLIWLALMLCLTATGCQKSHRLVGEGPNDLRKPWLLAQDQTVTHTISSGTPQSTHWFAVKAAGSGELHIRVQWDTPGQLEDARVTLHDKYGIQKNEMTHDTEKFTEETSVTVSSGYYFVRVHAEKGASVYSVQCHFQPAEETQDKPSPASL